VIVSVAFEDTTLSAPVEANVTLKSALAFSTAELTVNVVCVVLPTFAPA
jgi:hypothetical protein